MTTIVINAKTSTIRAHVERGALATPNPEDTLDHLASNPKPFNILSHVYVQTVDYLRRRREFFSYS